MAAVSECTDTTETASQQLAQYSLCLTWLVVLCFTDKEILVGLPTARLHGEF